MTRSLVRRRVRKAHVNPHRAGSTSRKYRTRKVSGGGIGDFLGKMFSQGPPEPVDPPISKDNAVDAEKMTRIFDHPNASAMPDDLKNWGDPAFPDDKRREAIQLHRAIDLSPDPSVYNAPGDYDKMAETYSRWMPDANNVGNFARTCTESADKRPQPTDRLVHFDKHFPGVELANVNVARISAEQILSGESDPNMLPGIPLPDDTGQLVHTHLTKPFANTVAQSVGRITAAQRAGEAYPGQLSERMAIQRLHPGLGIDGASDVQARRLLAYKRLMRRVRELIVQHCRIVKSLTTGVVKRKPTLNETKHLKNIQAEFSKLARLYDKGGIGGGNDYVGLGSIAGEGTKAIVEKTLAGRQLTRGSMVQAKARIGVDLTRGNITVGEAGEKARVVDAAGAALGEDHRLPPTRTGSEYFSPIDVPVTTRPRPASAPPEGWFNMLHKTVGDVLAPANAANAANAKAEIQHIGGHRSTRRRKARRSAVRSKILRRLMPGRTHRRNVARRTRRSDAWR
jgi:hypothetical protein